MHAIQPPRLPMVYTVTRCIVQGVVYLAAITFLGAVVYAVGAVGGAW